MSTITANPELISLLAQIRVTTEIRDTKGVILGVYVPHAAATEERRRSLFDLEAAERALATEGHAGCSLHDIWRDLRREGVAE